MADDVPTVLCLTVSPFLSVQSLFPTRFTLSVWTQRLCHHAPKILVIHETPLCLLPNIRTCTRLAVVGVL